MFISRTMTSKLVTLKAEEGIFEARDKMKTHDIRHLPVADKDGRLVGMVTDRDIRSALPRDCFDTEMSESEKTRVAALKVGDIMSTDLLTVTPTYTIQDALLLFKKKKVGAIPVVDDDGMLKGIVSVRDLLRAFVNVLGIGEPGTLLGIIAEEKVGQMKIIVDAITEENISIGSILVARYWEKDKRVVFPYLLTLNVSRVKKKLAGLGYTLLDPMEWYIDQLPQKQ